MWASNKSLSNIFLWNAQPGGKHPISSRLSEVTDKILVYAAGVHRTSSAIRQKTAIFIELKSLWYTQEIYNHADLGTNRTMGQNIIEITKKLFSSTKFESRV